jgi:hypothetical protein
MENEEQWKKTISANKREQKKKKIICRKLN